MVMKFSPGWDAVQYKRKIGSSKKIVAVSHILMMYVKNERRLHLINLKKNTVHTCDIQVINDWALGEEVHEPSVGDVGTPLDL